MAIDNIIARFELQTGQAQTEIRELTARLDAMDKELKTTAKDGKKAFSDIQQGAKQTGGAFGGMKAQLTSFAATMGVAFGAQEIIQFTKASIDAAADLGETLNKVGVIFGENASDIDAWASTAAQRLGQSKQQALDAASTFAIFGKSAGKTGEDLSGFAMEMTELATDLSSFHNTTPQEAVEALGATFRGEMEPIRKYGIVLDDATLRQEALRMKLIQTDKQALTPQQKILAAHAAIMRKTNLEQGDFANTADSLSNKQKILTAEFADFQTLLGQKLAPTYEKLVDAGGDLLKAFDWGAVFEQLMQIARDNFKPLMDIGSALGDLFNAFGKSEEGGRKMTGLFTVLRGVVNATLIPLKIIAAVLRLFVDNAIIPAVQTGQRLIAWFNEVREGGGFVADVFNVIAKAVGGLARMVGSALETIGILSNDSNVVDIVGNLREQLSKLGDEDQIKQLEEWKKQFAGNMQMVQVFENEIKAVRARMAKAAAQAAKEEGAAVSAAAQKAYEDRMKQLEDLEKAVQDANYEILQASLSAQEQEELAVEKKYKAQIDLAKQYANDSTAEGRRYAAVLAALQEASELEVLEIQKKYAELRELARIEERNKEREAEKKRAAERMEFLNSQEEQEVVAYDEAANKLLDQYNRRIISHEEFLNAMAKLDEDYNTAAKDRANKLDEERKKAAQQLTDSIIQSTQLFGETLTNIMAITGRNSQQFAEFSKALAIAEIAIAKGQTIANALTKISAGGLSGFALIAEIATVVASVTSVFASIASSVNSANAPELPQFESYNTGTPYLERGGNPRGIDTIPIMANEGEAIIPTDKNAKYPGMARAWIDGNLEDYIFRNYVIPQLEEQAASAAAARMEAFGITGQNVAGFDDFRLYSQARRQTGALEAIVENTNPKRQSRKRYYS
jgi:hypothetical protein